MEQVVSLLVENPLYLVIAVILSIVVLLLFLRKILKLLVIIAAVGILYVAYLYWSGENIPEVVKGIEQVLDRALQKGVGFLKQFADP
ncbi:hypothetical protein OO185_03560 [Prosthecochloris sp. SCSIO W1102]|uniref:hypothetical protein n=1 Tax=Prosthecochloris sp. SCSIO W1102 TaxID=2992243 RepID=UPI00223DD6FC|nr:hypothetical protein [Prosthecochloris sp. SCSIO W1102]UZJ39024.1 hypothetical protein OO185_03560 [Prosthecochloris sp. SCSIO W1102]